VARALDDTGWANVQRHMAVNFDAPVRLTEALLPLLRRSAPSSIVNVSSTAGRIGRPHSGAYSASKFALAGWSDALHGEEKRHGIHVGLVLPGFIVTEGFPQREIVGSLKTRWLVAKPDTVADAILDAGAGRQARALHPAPVLAGRRRAGRGARTRAAGDGGRRDVAVHDRSLTRPRPTEHPWPRPIR
jgi:short-subunit dehydrogenase